MAFAGTTGGRWRHLIPILGQLGMVAYLGSATQGETQGNPCCYGQGDRRYHRERLALELGFEQLGRDVDLDLHQYGWD